MKLTELFIGSKQTTDTGNTRSVSNAQISLINRQIRALTPGQTINGEVLSKNGNEVQIRLAEDMIINAKVDGGMNLELGKSIFFEVRNNGSALTLSPLFSNMSTDTNVLKALDMSGLPINNTTVSMTESMMEAGLSVDKNSMQQLFREINSFPEAELSDIIDLHKLKMPVTQENLNQISTYKNLTHQITDGLQQVVSSLGETVQTMVSDGNVKEAAGIYLELLKLVSDEAISGTTVQAITVIPQENVQSEGVTQQQVMLQPEGVLQTEGVVVQPEMLMQPEGIAVQQETLMQLGNVVQPDTVVQQENMQSEVVQQETVTQQELIVQPETVMSSEDLAQQGVTNETEVTVQVSGRQNLSAELTSITQTLTQAFQQGDEEAVKSILGNKEVQKLLADCLQEQWLISPEEVADEGKVDALYQKLNRQLKGIAAAFETAGQTESAAYRVTTNLSQNIDFLHQFNQMYTYVQLPLKLNQGQANGELYVYTNKKNLSIKDGQISALLHLDMEHLGPVDVYVAMNASKVNTKFYVQDDSMLDFLEAHMDILTERLRKRGYDCHPDLQIRNSEEKPNSGIMPLMEQQGNVPLVHYAFDMRA